MMEETTSFALASAVVLVYPERLQEVASVISTMPGVVVHHVSEVGKLVVTLEGAEFEPLADLLTTIKHTDGVLSADLIYQHFEEASAPHSKEMVL
ncbi:chaperone NapD [Candidatus Magnetaquicoccus inordinatus]|uniref:chaperone NapD n=1 Tax=Candidatus Magnetaquicoccus inordinatus TaxID=2496818 RepID=UPI00102AD2D6|nr:chaperone NapD [Candidatus Magnetaquicoccus inordinatus]